MPFGYPYQLVKPTARKPTVAQLNTPRAVQEEPVVRTLNFRIRTTGSFRVPRKLNGHLSYLNRTYVNYSSSLESLEILSRFHSAIFRFG